MSAYSRPASRHPALRHPAAAIALRLALGLMFAVLCLGGPARASVPIITINATTTATGLHDGQMRVGEVATPLTPLLQSYSLWVAATSPSLSFRPVIYEWDGSDVVGGPLYAGPVQTAAFTGAYAQYTFTPPGLTLDPSKQYVFAVERTVPGEQGVVQSGAQNTDPGYTAIFTAFWLGVTTDELHFEAVFDIPSPPAPVPTMTEWALILLGLVLAGGAVLTIRRRRAVA